jgi:SAM-dependent methyltransferase
MRETLRDQKRGRLAAWLNGEGIEIGALYRPLRVPPTAGVRYVDRMGVDDLRTHYPELAEHELVPVEVIGSAEDLSALPDESTDFVIANHLFEHLEYPIRGLAEFLRVLRPGGIVYLALPDQRVGIDQDRALTSVEHLLDEHRNGAEGNRAGHYRDWVVHSEKRPADEVEQWIQRFLDMDYSIHFHVWRSDTFLDFLTATRRDVGLDFEVVAFAPPEYEGDDEFIVVLSKGTSRHPRLPPAHPTAEGSRLTAIRRQVGASALGPVLRPPYRLARRLRRRLLRHPGSGARPVPGA